MKKFKRTAAFIAAASLICAPLALAGCADKDDTVVLRVCSWEEYIDLGDWDEEERIDIENPFADNPKDGIFGKNSMVDDFTEWFNDNHDYNIRVEYSTFGTNEDLYNRLSLGDVYDLVCPSDYMIMKLLSENACVEFSDGFWDLDNEENYYANYVSRYIDGENGEGIYNTVFTTPEEIWHGKAACYMWGTTGLVYNPDKVDEEDVSTWQMLLNSKYKRQVTIKDNVRDAYFAALGIVYKDLLTPDNRADYMNKVTPDAISAAEDVLKQIKDNVYSFETDSGKADMVTGKVIANFQWSGDAVYIMDEADDDDTELWYSVPDECANLWFDGWVMLKKGVGTDAKKKEAAEAFVNFLSRPDNAVRNMYYIGYTSAIAGDSECTTVYDYMEWNYGADEEEVDKELIREYDLSYFFGDEISLSVDMSLFGFEGEWEDGQINKGRQLFAQYPPENVIDRSVVMLDFGDKLADLNQMWINVRCLDIRDISPVTIGVTAGVIVLAAAAICLYAFRYRIFNTGKPKKGYKKV
ncbi:MAG: extracellular solute-binding protein [Clostridiales bacterium]|nr:extracellular solute-binding protein [Clostridiales bacterium]